MVTPVMFCACHVFFRFMKRQTRKSASIAMMVAMTAMAMIAAWERGDFVEGLLDPLDPEVEPEPDPDVEAVLYSMLVTGPAPELCVPDAATATVAVPVT
jgi:hypothetical protein